MAKIGEEDAKALTACRYQARKLMQAQEEYANRDAKSRAFDGMPHARGTGAGLEREIISDEAARLRLKTQERRYKRAARAAEAALMRIDASDAQSAFWTAYYIEGATVAQAREKSGCAMRTAWHYRAQIQRAARGE